MPPLEATADSTELENTAVIPTPKLENDFYDWYARHEEKCRLVRQHSYDLVFLGDSITHHWETGDIRGRSVWEAAFEPLNALNLGFGWDRTQNVLWRLEHGELENQTPKLAVILIGTNNLTGTGNARKNTPEEIAAGNAAIFDKIQSISPKTAILSVGILPRDKPDSEIRSDIKKINPLLKKLADLSRNRHFIDIGAPLMQNDGTISTEIMNDLTHPTTAGYSLMAEQLLPEIRRITGL